LRKKDCARYAKCVERSRETAVRGGLQQRFSYLLMTNPVIDGADYVRAEFSWPVEGGEHDDIEQTPRFPIQARPSPDGSPAELRRKLLQWQAEFIRIVERLLNTLVPQYFSPDL
jgi:hypothetical protein